MSEPEQIFFQDPAIDRVLGFVMTLATEVWVLRDRVFALEQFLASRGVVEPGALDTVRLDNAADRDAFVRHLMNNLLGMQASKGAPDDLLSRFG